MYKKVVGLLCALTISCVVYAVSESSSSASAPAQKKNSDSSSQSAELNSAKITSLVENNTRLSVLAIKSSIVPGLAEVHTDQGLYYASNDGQYFIPGKVYTAIPGVGLTDMSELSMTKTRIEGIKKFEQDMVIYPAKNEKHVITVFTDITCGYCRKMHNLMDEYNDLGITVRYLAYPRHGITDESGNLTQGFKDLRSIWCHETPEAAMTKAKQGQSVAYRVCDAPIEAEFKFGQQIGVNGTPAIVLENGMMLPGFREPQDLASTLANM
ncbi:MAG: thioredoxin fold domain-containing protein [Thalassotalea sp.]